MKKRTFGRLSLYAGLFLLLLGLQLFAVEGFLLSSEATSVLAQWTGPGGDSVEGAVRHLIVDVAAPQKMIVPPVWLRWLAVSLGVVLIARGWMSLRK